MSTAPTKPTAPCSADRSQPLMRRPSQYLHVIMLSVLAVGTAACTDEGLAPTDAADDIVAIDAPETNPDVEPPPDVLAVTRVEPAEGPTDGLVQTEIHGTRLSTVTSVYFGPVAALDVFPVNDRLIVLLTPPHPAGHVDLRLFTADEEAPPLVVERAYLYRDPVAVTAVNPDSGHPMGGERVTVSGDGFTSNSIVIFGTRRALAANVVDSRTITCVAPHGEPGTVDVHVATEYGSASLRRAFTYIGGPLPSGDARITSITPDRGPQRGGTRVTLTGSGIANSASIRVGALPATGVTIASDGRSVTFTTPPGAPGPAPVHILQGGTITTRPDAFTYEAGASEIYLTLPSRGATAGGTRVRLIGAALPTRGPVDVRVGGKAARDVVAGDGTFVDFVTPAGSVGASAVELTISGGSALTLPRGYTYFDPASQPGTWGGPIDGNINITVIDSRSGVGLAGAFVMLGPATSSTQFRGNADGNGQIVFSRNDLLGPQMVTASRNGYQTMHLTGFDAENITVPLERAPTCEDVEDMPCDQVTPPPVGAVFEGTIIGSAKGPSLPFGRCFDWSDHPAGHCEPCTTASTCATGDAPAACLPLGNEGSFCTTRCAQRADCPGDFVCVDPTGRDEDRRCVPPPGEAAVFCDITEPSINATDTVPWPGRQVNAENRVRFDTRLGQYAVFCWGGHIIRGSFTADRMGVVRGLTAEIDGTVVQADIRLDIPLSDSVTLVLDRPTLGRGSSFLDGDRAMLRTFLDLGGDGVAEFAPFRAIAVRSFQQAIPARLSATLHDATWTLLGGVESPSLNGGSMLIERNLKTLQAAFDYRFNSDGTWEALPATMDTTWGLAAWSSPGGDETLLAVGDDGRIGRLVGNAWARMTTDSRAHLRTVATAPMAGANGFHQAIAGGEGGVAVHWTGLRWEARPTGTENVFTSIVFVDADIAFATAGELVLRWDGDEWTTVFTATAPLAGIATHPDGRVIAVGEKGLVVEGRDGIFETIAVPTIENLTAAAVDAAGGIDIVGDEGVWLHGSVAGSFDILEVPAIRDLKALARNVAPGIGDAVAVGADGTIQVRRGISVTGSDPGVSRSTIRGVAAIGDRMYALGSHERVVGPLMGIPESLTPVAGGFLASSLSWTAREGLTPHFNVIDFESSIGPCSACGFLFMLPFTEWRTVTEGTVSRADFPELMGVSNTQPLSRGFKSLAIYRVRVDGSFDFNNSAASGFFGSDWRAWAWRYATYIR